MWGKIDALALRIPLALCYTTHNNENASYCRQRRAAGAVANAVKMRQRRIDEPQ
jgi:hypothetical protein